MCSKFLILNRIFKPCEYSFPLGCDTGVDKFSIYLIEEFLQRESLRQQMLVVSDSKESIIHGIIDILRRDGFYKSYSHQKNICLAPHDVDD